MAQADAEREARTGIGKAIAIEQQVAAYGGPQLQLAQDVMTKLAAAVQSAGIPIVPQTVVNMGGDGEGAGSGMGNNAFGLLLTLLTAEKLGAPVVGAPKSPEHNAQVARMKQQIMDSVTREPAATGPSAPKSSAPKVAAPAPKAPAAEPAPAKQPAVPAAEPPEAPMAPSAETPATE
jgi:hypothetical protein